MIAIVDYGLGNIKAFLNVYRRLNIDCSYASTSEELKKASKIILPGVGAFDHAMKTLNQSGLRDTLDELVLIDKVPVIGICVGMQMMAEGSDEGEGEGLGWIKGRVRKLQVNMPLPHMGWNNITPERESDLIRGLDEERRFYFLHSYYFDCDEPDDILATAEYPSSFPCIINHGNVYGIQCHPEKSHHNGVSLLKNFSEL